MERYLLLLICVPILVLGCDTGPADDDDDDDDTVEEALVVLTGDLPDGRVGYGYETTVEADTTAAVTWSLDGGSLPPGIDLTSDGTVAGTPTASGDFEFALAADDGTLSGTAELRIHVPAVVLISGFGPFVGYPSNPSIEAVLPLDGELVGGLDVYTVELPVVWDTSWDLLLAEIEVVQPDIVIGTGVANTDAMRYEVTAVNTEWGTDIDGNPASGGEVVEGGPSSLETMLPVEEMADAVDAAGLPTTLSNDAGTYLCNHIFYHVVHHAELEADWPILAGFVHVPPVGYGSALTIEQVTEAHELGLGALADWLASGDARRTPLIETREAPVY